MTICSIYNYLYETDFYTCGKKDRQLTILQQNPIVHIPDAQDLEDLYVCVTQLQEYYILQADHNFYTEVASLAVPYMTHEFIMWILNQLNKDYKPVFLRDEIKKGFRIISKSFKVYRDMNFSEAIIMALQDSESGMKEKIRCDSLALLKKKEASMKELREAEQRMREIIFDSYSAYTRSMREEDYSLRVLKEVKQKLSAGVDEAEILLRNLIKQNDSIAQAKKRAVSTMTQTDDTNNVVSAMTRTDNTNNLISSMTQTDDTNNVVSAMTQTDDVRNVPVITDMVQRSVVLTAERTSVLSASAPPWSPKNQRSIITSREILTGVWPQPALLPRNEWR